MELPFFEGLCRATFTPTNREELAEAQAQLLALQSNAEYITQCQFFLDTSQYPHAQAVASNSLEVLVTQFWNSLSLDEKLVLRDYALHFLWTRAHALEEFVLGSVTKLVCRITKLGWFDRAEHREIIDRTKSFLDGSVDHSIVGLKLLNALVDEMNTPTQGRTLTVHRKTAVSFRDQALFVAFQTSIVTLQKVKGGMIMGMTDVQQKKITNLSLMLATNCLSFDFIGTNPEESAEDVGTVQVPSSWRPMVQETTTMTLFFEFYGMSCESCPQNSSLALQALVQFSSVRRSLFSSEKERCVFLQALMDGIRHIMSTMVGLSDSQNYHEFCRLLGRLKASYQLSELVRTNNFNDWLKLAGDFTITSLQSWQFSMNSIHYLLALWGRLVAALPYLRNDAMDAQQHAQILRTCVLQVVQSYIETMLQSVEVVVTNDGSVEDPLDDESSLREAMDRLPVIARLQFDTVAQMLINTFEALLGQYHQGIALAQTPQVAMQLKIVEGRLTWLTHIVAAVIGAQSDARKSASELQWDGPLCKYVFSLCSTINQRLTDTGGQGKCDQKLELAILQFFKSFKKVYMLDSVGGPSLGAVGGSPAHPLLSLALSYGGIGESELKVAEPEALTVSLFHKFVCYSTSSIASTSLTIPSHAPFTSRPPPHTTQLTHNSHTTTKIFDAMSDQDHRLDVQQVMNLVVDKMCNNIRYWHDGSSEILEQTLEVFVELVSSYSSSKTLLGLETVRFLVHNHVGAHFPFLGYDRENKQRITFYSALSRLVFSSSEDMDNMFDRFIAPNLEIMAQLSNSPDLTAPGVRTAIIGALRDLRGITVSAYNKRTYYLLFDALYPSSFPLLTRIAQTWYADPDVMTALLKFMQEFVHNKGQRIYFDQSSANGILLFRETSQILCAYGSRILEVPVVSDIYLEKYKGIRLMLNTLTSALTGNYVNFGIFSLYQDPALQNSLDIALQMCLNIPLTDVMTHVKLSKAYYGCLEVLFRNHLDVLCGLDSKVFLQLVNANHEGLQSSGTSHLTSSVEFFRCSH